MLKSHQLTRRHIPENSNVRSERRNNVESVCVCVCECVRARVSWLMTQKQSADLYKTWYRRQPTRGYPTSVFLNALSSIIQAWRPYEVDSIQ